jgi:NAD(P)-dependent dehydrogenase (short-subunit alcohol dehydrogenase family)
MLYIENQFSLKGKNAVITGGGGTLCGAIAEGFLKTGAKVALWGRNMESLVNKRDELVQKGCDASSICLTVVDLLHEDQIDTALKKTISKSGQIDILINGVGGSSIRCPLVETNTAEFEKIVKLNLVAGCFLPSKLLADYWIKNNIRGTILNIASMASYNPLSGGWAYSAAKAAVVNQTMAQARELADYGIRVNALAPGFFLGKQNKRLLENEDGTPTERGKSVLAHTPFNRFGDPQELCAPAIFLCADGASFVSGITLPVDGAYLCSNI